ncbi:MAG: OmpA family protein [Elusimicrobiaceae bacterium]|nr:OmpA family protein [Elusimicrobiaceae bacterium]MBP5616199.1 OmpA family protein [Elusimicrobiaceae bacterium]
MKKVMIVLAAASFLGACHCTKCAHNACKVQAKPAPAPVVVAKPAPAPAPVAKVENDAAVATVANVKTNAAGAAVLSFKEPINFAYNSATMDAKSTATVEKTAAILKKYPNAKIRVAGYTDSMGNPAYNMDLSERRAHAVAEGLVKNGVPAANVSYIGYGEANPVATNKTAEGRYQNRRVELEVTNK